MLSLLGGAAQNEDPRRDAAPPNTPSGEPQASEQGEPLALGHSDEGYATRNGVNAVPVVAGDVASVYGEVVHDDADAEESYEARNEKLKLKSIQVTVRAGTAREFPVRVFPGCVVEWNFQTQGGDISFVVFLELDNGELVTLVEKKRYSSHEEVVNGKLVLKESGILWLHWDNAFSWFRNKELVYSITRNNMPKTSILFILNQSDDPAKVADVCRQQALSDLSVTYLQMSDIMQREIEKPGSSDAKLLSVYAKESKPIPAELKIKVLLRQLDRIQEKIALVDGFPLTEQELHSWERETSGSFNILGLFHFKPSVTFATSASAAEAEALVSYFDTTKALWTFAYDMSSDAKLAAMTKILQKLMPQANTSPVKQLSQMPSSSSIQDPGTAAVAGPVAVPPTTAPVTSPASTGNAVHSNGIKERPVRVILGTMTMAGQVSSGTSLKMVTGFVEDAVVARHLTGGKVELDTARMYQGGKTEETLGDIFERERDLLDRVYVATKVNPFGKNTLRPESVVRQLNQSLDAMRLDSVDLLYLHAPDHSTDILSTLEAVNSLYLAGKFRELGLSNYSAWETVHIWHVCKENGWVQPTVYQGMYNPITRQVEAELLPALRKCNIRFYAYNPLAGGLLSGKYKSIRDQPSDGRFGLKGFKDRYRPRFWTEEHFEAVSIVRRACEAEQVPMAEAAFRWLTHHSKLKGGKNDGLIIGASSMKHQEANLSAIAKGPLPTSIVDAYDAAWQACRASCPNYAR